MTCHQSSNPESWSPMDSELTSNCNASTFRRRAAATGRSQPQDLLDINALPAARSQAAEASFQSRGIHHPPFFKLIYRNARTTFRLRLSLPHRRLAPPRPHGLGYDPDPAPLSKPIRNRLLWPPPIVGKGFLARDRLTIRQPLHDVVESIGPGQSGTGLRPRAQAPIRLPGLSGRTK